MNKDLFDSMQKQMDPGPEVRAALCEKLAHSVKRRIPVRQYAAVAACAALVIGGLSAYRLYRGEAKWAQIIQSYRPNANIQYLHSYVTVEDAAGYAAENTGALIAENGVEEIYYTGPIDRGSGAPNTGDLPSGDVPVQEGAEDYQALMAHFNGVLPDWYGGAYLDETGRLVVLLVEVEDPMDKTWELRVQEWTGSDSVRFGSAKYPLNHLKGLMDRLNRLPDADLKYADVMAGWGIDEENNRVELTLTQAYEPILSVLAELDPEDDAVYVQVAQRAAAYAGVEDPAVIMPGGTTVPEDDENLIAIEPWVDSLDGAHYDVEQLPEQKQPAVIQSVPEEDADAPTASETAWTGDPRDAVTYDVETGEITITPYPYGASERPESASGGTRAYNPEQ